MSLTLIKSFFSREAEIRRLRKANESLTSIILKSDVVCPLSEDNSRILVHLHGWESPKHYKLYDASHDNFR